MLTVQGYVVTAVLFHLCLVIGLLSFAVGATDPNRLMGLRTPRTSRSDEDWRKANGQMSRIMPIVSGVCAAVSLSGIWIDELRTGIAFLLIVGVQLGVLIGLAAKWWASPE